MTLTREGYRPRLIDTQIERMLNTFGAVCIEGPRWCGKSWTAYHHSNTAYEIGDSRNNFQNRNLAMLSPDMALKGDIPHMIDEWQDVPSIWDTVRSEVDKSTEKGRFILTGSSTPAEKGIMHSGDGRIGSIRMRTMSLYETGDSDGSVSLKGMFEGQDVQVNNRRADLSHLADLCVRGGWPGALGVDPSNYELIPKDYLDKTVSKAARLDDVRRDREKMFKLVRSLGRNEGTMATKRLLKKDMMDLDGEPISEASIDDYLDCLNRVFMLDDQPMFSPNVRSSLRIGKSVKRHLTDPSLAVAAMGLNSERLISDLKTFGFIFESLCIHDLRIYAEHNGGRLFHYHDSNDNEIDAVVEAHDGTWGAFEVKLGAEEIEGAAKNLKRISNLLVKNGAEPPKMLCIICGMTDYSYRREDGIYVTPITMLGP